MIERPRPGLNAQLIGSKAAVSVLARLPKAVRRRVVTNSVRKGGRVIQAGAKRRVNVVSGTLRDSIIVRTLRGLHPSVAVGPSKQAGWYGFLVEFGTRHSEPHPFLREATDEDGDQAMREVREGVGAETLRAAAKLAGPIAKSGLLGRGSIIRRFG